MSGAPRSTSSRWCSATWARPRPPASPSPGTRPPARDQFYGEFLVNAQGEDVVAGIRTPEPDQRSHQERPEQAPADPPEDHARSLQGALRHPQRLEKHYRDMQDIEFTIEEGQLYMLQCRVGKRNGPAALQDRAGHARGEADRRRKRRSCASPRPSSTSSCTRSWTRRPRAATTSSPRACRPVPAARAARSSSPPPTPWPGPTRQEGHPRAARRQTPRTSRGCARRWAS